MKNAYILMTLVVILFFSGTVHGDTRICPWNVDASCVSGWLSQSLRYTFTDADRRNYYALFRSPPWVLLGWSYFDGVWQEDQKTVAIGLGNGDYFVVRGCTNNSFPGDCSFLNAPRSTPVIQMPRKKCRAER